LEIARGPLERHKYPGQVLFVGGVGRRTQREVAFPSKKIAQADSQYPETRGGTPAGGLHSERSKPENASKEQARRNLAKTLQRNWGKGKLA